jgi:FkbM family methyltransferase
MNSFKGKLTRFIKRVRRYDFTLNLQLLKKRSAAERKIFVDCGANTGKVFQKFYTQKKSFEFHLFEPQPELYEQLNKLVEKLNTKNVTFYNKAIWTKNGPLDLFLATNWGPNYKGGSTVIKGHLNNHCEINYETPVIVESIDFAEWLISDLKIKSTDYLIVKMDIEGSEYEVLENLIEKSRLKYIDELIVEFHYHMNEDSLQKKRHDTLIKKLKAQKGLKLIIWH